ncbi:MAG TPA: carbohydrate binding domain-containing protein [Pyrinomonadaceae bacterium]|nr:carbohydrate binding domain-containing protein [Pyrinomonadaceae bacterium]
MLRVTISLLGILLCLVLILNAGKYGFSRLLTRYALSSNSLVAANQAVAITPADAEAHRARAVVLDHLLLKADGTRELEIAASLRPHDDAIWLALGGLRDSLDDSDGALNAYNQAVRFAPFYAHTNWERGNLKLRMGRYDEAFSEMRQAAAKNPNLLPTFIDLALGVSRGDVTMAEQLVQINDDLSRLAFARTLALKGRGDETLKQLQLLKTPVNSDTKQELVRQLLATKCYREAFELWNSGSGNHDLPVIVDGGFESSLSVNNTGFGWRFATGEQKVEMSQDTTERQSGTRSLKINFAGHATPGNILLSQYVVVEPDRTYKINYAVKSREVISGGPPVITVEDVESGETLGRSEPIAETTDGWRSASFSFTAKSTAKAVVLGLRRNYCQTSPCPIFGVVWLDSFSIEALPGAQ